MKRLPLPALALLLLMLAPRGLAQIKEGRFDIQNFRPSAPATYLQKNVEQNPCGSCTLHCVSTLQRKRSGRRVKRRSVAFSVRSRTRRAKSRMSMVDVYGRSPFSQWLF